MQQLRKVASFSTPTEDLKEIYILVIRSILEHSATVWHSSLTRENIDDLERVQKSALRTILQEKYKSYKQGLALLNLETLSDRRESLCLNFALKCVKDENLSRMFPISEKTHKMGTRKEEQFEVQFANTGRLQKSPIIYMQKLLNENTKK